MKKIFYTMVKSPVGELFLAGTDGKLTDLRFGAPRNVFPGPEWVKSDRPFGRVRKQLRAYFEGKLREFDLQLEPEGTTFQLEAWKQLRMIPYGQTISYGEQARRMGRAGAARAAGAANRANPIAIIIPCHRVIGAAGHLTGFGGGLDIKQRLLELEGAAGFRTARREVRERR
jgi:methylated-DNA-[protein]-cysteine S-methyltransferase